MFRPSDPQRKLFDAGGLLSAKQRDECEKSWAGPFRQKCLPILKKIEEEFADLFDPKMGRPNRPVALTVGTLILKEMRDLTDEETVEALDFDARWWYAFELEPHDERLCPKTLYNFRGALLERPDKEEKKLTFRRVTDELIGALGVRVDRQRLDSKHIVSNIAILTRYQDARKAEGPRRLGVVARDVGRLVDRFEHDKAVTSMEGWKLLWRLYQEQCDPTLEPEEPGKEDDDQGERGVCAALREAKEVSKDSLQSPHDPTVTYSGHKGKGFEVQVSETCVAGNPVQLVTDVEVTRSSGRDREALVPTVDRLTEAGHKPQEVVADTNYSGAKNAAALAQRGGESLGPGAGGGQARSGGGRHRARARHGARSPRPSAHPTCYGGIKLLCRPPGGG